LVAVCACSVKLTFTNETVPVEVKQNPKHKKNPEAGNKDTVYGPVILVEQVDALSFQDQEEASLHAFVYVSVFIFVIRLLSWTGVTP